MITKKIAKDIINLQRIICILISQTGSLLLFIGKKCLGSVPIFI